MENQNKLKSLLKTIENFENIKVVIIGDFYLDEYIYTESEKLSPEAPVPRAIIKSSEKKLGAAANIASNFAELGAKVEVVGVIGGDYNGDLLINLLKEKKINTEGLIRDSNRVTGTFSRVLLDVNKQINQHVIRIDYENANKLSFETKNKLISILREKIFYTDCVFVADYDETDGKGIISEDILEIVSIISKSNQKLSVGISREKIDLFKNLDVVILNEKELEKAIGFKIDINSESLLKSARLFKEKLNNKIVVITLGEKGLIAISDNEFFEFSSFAEKVVDVCGAGDSLSSAFVLSLISNSSLAEACEIGNFAASIVISKNSTVTVSKEELKEVVFKNKLKSFKESKILDLEILLSLLENERRKGKKIVFTNGYFDFIHKGHIKFLRESKKLGDILVVAINSDSSTRSNKGLDRPFISQEDRSIIISSFDFVDYVVVFDELTPIQIISKIQPDVLVKGGQTKTRIIVGKDIVESKGGKVIFLPSYGSSTEDIIKSIREG